MPGSNASSDRAHGHSAEARPGFYEEIQAVFYQRVTARASRGAKSKTRLDAYYDDLAVQARQGDINAIKETNALQAYLERENKTVEPPSSAGRDLVNRLIEEQNQLRATAEPFVSLAYALTKRQLERDLERKQGHASQIEFSRPFFVQNISFGERLLQRLNQRRAKERGEAEPDVGHCKPPVRTRFKEGQSGNPTGRRKQVGDEWTSFRDSLVKQVPTLVGGRRTKLTSIAVTTRRLFDLAQKGDPRARRELRKLIIELDKRGLLKTPPTRPRRRRSRSRNGSRIDTCVLVAALLLCQLSIKEDREVANSIAAFGFSKPVLIDQAVDSWEQPAVNM